MQLIDPNEPATYAITQIIPSRGLAAVARDGDGVLLDFYEERGGPACPNTVWLAISGLV